MKRIYLITMFILLCFLLAASPVDARTFSIDKVHIKAWIQPNGDLIINEVFSYTFDGEYNRVRRSVHLDGHDGVKNFEAYELLNQDRVPGFIDRGELRPLEVQQDGNDLFAELHAINETKTALFIYELKNAVRSYDAYSDLTIPFFGTGKNHGADLQNVTIDFVFPEPVGTDDYHAFIHEPDGELLEKTEEVVRFYTPVSQKRELTEVRLLFPSAIMKKQSKQTAPVSLENILKEENKLVHAETEKMEAHSKVVRLLYAITVLFALMALGLVFLPQRIGRGSGNHGDLLMYDPLELYVIDRAGKKDDFAFLAGILSLVDKGLVTISDTKTLIRFAQDGEAPARTLSFAFRQGLKQMSESENILLDWLFTRKVKGGIRIFSMNNIYGATQTEKKERKEMYGYYLRRFRFMQMERRWFHRVILNIKGSGLVRGTFCRIAGRFLMISIMAGIVLAYFVNSAPGFGILLYTAVSGYLLKKGWAAEGRSQMFLILAISLLAAIFIIDTGQRVPYILFVLSGSLLFAALPEFLLSTEAARIRADIRMFRRQLKQEGIPSMEDDANLERRMGLALILRAKKFTIQPKESEEWMKAAPLSAFILSEGNPMNYLFETWKLSKPPLTFYKTNKPQGKDNSSSFDGGSGGGSYGGDSGGGAGAD